MNWEELKQEQPTVMTMLEQSVEKGRLAHAYLFEGMKGTGKRDASILLAKALFCQDKTETIPCENCIQCRRISHGNHPDVMIVDPEGNSIKKAQVEALQKEFAYKGMEAGLKVYIVNEADKMTASAANSLLKFLEEPESPTLALLLTENVHFMLDTIISRSQKIAFAPPPIQKRISLYEEQGLTQAAASILARFPDDIAGEYAEEKRDWIVHGRNLVIQLVEEVQHRPQQMLLTLQEKWLPHFTDRQEQDIGLDLLLFWYRDILSVKYEQDNLAYPDQREKLKQDALQLSEKEVAKRLQQILEAKRRLRANVNVQLLMEQLLLHLQEGS
ncbi:DNA polymerase-3 subunit delta' [Alteribacillus persepolensis]|uniref:DNA polymerase III subunit delta' n=1 Tax=Alteribacillus persepolensis TaxID=568899 RepID=A0A1G8HXA0_9BACI|nr:DNA polymerase III subunit delta' [Alteribacillus persepolensis]SDI11335.1 DNA polymerase-3 subunit delta' [Alteribacillus persepolensis]